MDTEATMSVMALDTANYERHEIESTTITLNNASVHAIEVKGNIMEER